MERIRHSVFILILLLSPIIITNKLSAQDLPLRYATLELFTNTPCPICGAQNPGLFSRLAGYEDLIHLISFYPGKPYSSCIFYQANTSENTARFQFYAGQVFGTPTVVINGTEFKNSSGVTTAVLNSVTGDSSWLSITIDETTGTDRTANIHLNDHVGGSLGTGRLFAVIVEKEVMYTAPNGETIHRNVFRQFLTGTGGEDVDMSAGTATRSYSYSVDPSWEADQTYVIAWLMDPVTKEIFNSGTRFDSTLISADENILASEKLSVYPNPASGEITVQMPERIASGNIYVVDLEGRVQLARTANTQREIHFDVSDLAAGRYVVLVKSGRHMFNGGFDLVK